MEELKEEAIKQIESLKDELIELSDRIHKNPELGFEEHKACAWLTDMLSEHGFEVERGVAGLKTAFRATFTGSKEHPRVALLAEYDALPEIGHACGHNIIAASSVGAAIALSKLNLPGTVVVLGTPAEEGGGGKIIMIEQGAFKGIDAAMMIHPSDQNLIWKGSLAIKQIRMKFKGKSAHAAAKPEKGINALDAVIQTFNNINALRQHLTEDVRIHGIITHGGVKPNMVPDYAEAYFYVRALEENYLLEVLEKVKNCAKGAALAQGAKVEFEIGRGYRSHKPNHALAEAFEANLLALGVKPDRPPEHGGIGSSDIGDVSHVVPAIHPYISITEGELPGHSPEFAEAACSEKGHRGLVIGAKALAMTAIDLFIHDILARREESWHR
ncbi:M20 family metallopeptidase [Dehalococcoidia bacterium]|nr:M20 family metallopeptidase [Dehalococcoidia bacterium]